MPTSREQRQQQFEEFMRLMQTRKQKPMIDPALLAKLMAPKPEVPEAHPYLGAGIRGIAGMLSGAATMVPGYGIPLGAGVAGAGEVAAELAEGSKLSPKRIAVEAGLGAVPLKWLFGAAKVPQAIARGAAYSGVGEAGRELAREEELDPATIAGSTVIGGSVGGLLAKLLGGAARPPT